MTLSNETLVKIALEELTRPLYEYKMPDNVSMPLDTGDNRDPYGWDLWARLIYGESYSSFVNLDVMPGVVAIGFNGPNPSLEESCYNPRTQLYFDLEPDSNSSIDIGLSNLLGKEKLWKRYYNYITRIVDSWPSDKISNDDIQRIKECFIKTVENMETFYCPVVGKNITFVRKK